MGGIFVSYRRDDARGQARALSDALMARFGPERVFRDVEALAPGVDFPEAIASAIDRSDVFLAVIGDKWLTAEKDGRRRLDDADDHVRREIATALARDVRVIPVLLESAVMPSRHQLPAELGELADRNAIRLTDETWDDGINRLVRAIEPGRAKRHGARPGWVPVGIGVGVIAVGLVAFTLLGGSGGDGGGRPDVADVTLPSLQRAEVNLELAPAAGRPGTRVTAQGSGFQPDERVEIRFFTDIVARVRADDRGAFSGATFTVPDTPFRRPTPVTATGEQSIRTAEATFTVQ
ncbi:MAG: toll/interleukin-1 receptor domain-containing protein [Acidimicrobiia bacterium]